jgi:hypothetical protein
MPCICWRVELGRSRGPDFPAVCTGSFTSSMSLPCGHQLRRLSDVDAGVDLADIHLHSVFPSERAESSLPERPERDKRTFLYDNVLEPEVVRARGRPQQAPEAQPTTVSETIGSRVRRHRARMPEAADAGEAS